MITRNQARERWQALADAEFDPNLLLWVANVAADVLKADTEPTDSRRYAKLVTAVGLFGRLNTEREVIQTVVAVVDEDCALIKRGSRWQAARPLKPDEQRLRRRDAVVLALGLNPDKAADHVALDKRIQRALKGR